MADFLSHKLVGGGMVMARCQEGNEGLLAAASALAISMSQGKTAEELNTLALFFTVLGDSLALLALRSPPQEEGAAP